MKIAIMQPYFYPYIGYLSLIKHTDRFIILDVVQYIYHGWIARNRILKPGNGWQYIKVPVKSHTHETCICDVEIHDLNKAQRRITAQLDHYRKKAPFFREVMNMCKDTFSGNYSDITSLNCAALESILEYLGIDRAIEVFSKMELCIELPKSADEWSLNICKSLGNVSEYWNPPGGKSFFDREKFMNNGIELRFHEVDITPYDQKRSVFEPGLSILDVLMFNSVEDTNAMLDRFILS